MNIKGMMANAELLEEDIAQLLQKFCEENGVNLSDSVDVDIELYHIGPRDDKRIVLHKISLELGINFNPEVK
ncbi:MAG: hypothetical protein GY906_28425 [bacterium]|nr:hypothetical protein [bacterium]